jgi:uncharacterized protein (TIGR03118 family)
MRVPSGLNRAQVTSPLWRSGSPNALPVSASHTVPRSPLAVTMSVPSGLKFAPLSWCPCCNGSPSDFPVATSATTTLGPASFIFASEDGQIRAWRGGTTALVTAHGGPDAINKGLAIAQPTPGQPLLYATDFHNARVDVFNGLFKLVTPAGAFTDPNLPDGYGPFGIQNLGGKIFVSYAKQDADAEARSTAWVSASWTCTTRTWPSSTVSRPAAS